MDNIAILISDITKSAGTERAVVNLANSMVSETDNKVFIISVYSSKDDQPFYKIDKRVKIIHLREKIETKKILRTIQYIKIKNRIQKIIENKNIGIVLGTIHAFNMILSFLQGCIKIGCEHLNYNSCPRIVRILRKMTYKNLDKVVLLTNEDAKHYSFLPKDKLTVIPNISSFERNEKAQLDNHKIITVGRLSKQKGYDILIDIIDDIKKEMSDWCVDIYGVGEDKKMLQEKIKNLSLERIITIKEPVTNIKEKMLDTSVYIMTSRNEGLPMVLIEAQTCGLPIISFDCPEGPREIIHDGKDGYLIPVHDYELMKRKLLKMIGDDMLRKQLGDYAYNQSERFSPNNIVHQWCNLFNEVKRKKNAYNSR